MALIDVSELNNGNRIPDFNIALKMYKLLTRNHVASGFDYDGTTLSGGEAVIGGDPFILSGTQDISLAAGEYIILSSVKNTAGTNETSNITRTVKVDTTVGDSNEEMAIYYNNGTLIEDLRDYIVLKSEVTDDIENLDSNVVHKTGDENVNGIKTFLKKIIVSGLESSAIGKFVGGSGSGGTSIGTSVITDGNLDAAGDTKCTNVQASKQVNGQTLNLEGNASIAGGDTKIGQNVISIGYHQAKNFISKLANGTVGIRFDNDASDMSTIMEPLRVTHANGNVAIRIYRVGSEVADERALVVNSYETTGAANAGLFIGKTISTGADFGMVQHAPGNGNRYKLQYASSAYQAEINSINLMKSQALINAELLENELEATDDSTRIAKTQKTLAAQNVLINEYDKQLIKLEEELNSSIIYESEE